jgi:AcrR family transcriptional regulator
VPRTRGPAYDRTRARILATARALVLKNGYERLSLREVARRAGFSPASLYEYFASKDEIVRALAEQAGTELSDRLVAAALNARTDVGRIVDLGLAYVAFARERREDFLLLFSRLPSSRRARSQSVPAASPYRVVLDAVARGQQTGDIAAGDREPIAYSVWALAHGLAMLQLTHLSSFSADFERADRTALEILVKGWTVTV